MQRRRASRALMIIVDAVAIIITYMWAARAGGRPGGGGGSGYEPIECFYTDVAGTTPICRRLANADFILNTGAKAHLLSIAYTRALVASYCGGGGGAADGQSKRPSALCGES